MEAKPAPAVKPEGDQVLLLKGLGEMHSASRNAYDENCEDIRRLLEIHADIGGDKAGRKWGLEVLNKSGIVLVCSFWEAYCEDLAAECLGHLVTHAADPELLPKRLRQQIALDLHDDKNQLAPWSLAGEGWRDVLTARLKSLQEERNRSLNTPKAANIDDLFDRALGIERVSNSWKWPKTSADEARARLDAFVTLRGGVAHRGKAASTVSKKDVTGFLTHAERLVAKTDAHVHLTLFNS